MQNCNIGVGFIVIATIALAAIILIRLAIMVVRITYKMLNGIRLITEGWTNIEMRTWLDGNNKNESRAGLFVTSNVDLAIGSERFKDRVYKATSKSENILGVVVAAPSYIDENANPLLRSVCLVGTHGAYLVKDDGTCKVNGYCMPNDDGIATSTTTGYKILDRINKILDRINDGHILVYIK